MRWHTNKCNWNGINVNFELVFGTCFASWITLLNFFFRKFFFSFWNCWEEKNYFITHVFARSDLNFSTHGNEFASVHSHIVVNIISLDIFRSVEVAMKPWYFRNCRYVTDEFNAWTFEVWVYAQKESIPFTRILLQIWLISWFIISSEHIAWTELKDGIVFLWNFIHNTWNKDDHRNRSLSSTLLSERL